MEATPVIAIFDIGKTNKKFFLFNQDYQIVAEESNQFEEIADDDGDPCDNVQLLTAWVIDTLQTALQNQQYSIKAVNFSTYGASFVHLNQAGKVITPLYNYLKAFPEHLHQQFYQTYGAASLMAVETASPTLGNLNSGMQLYWLKHSKPAIYQQIAYSLHLPQYISALVSQQYHSDITSIGCHTQLWNFAQNSYHNWVLAEGIQQKLAPLYPSNQAMQVAYATASLQVGVGLHDSSAALIPYLSSFSTPFVLISTGTWCITLNPFNKEILTYNELQQDCLCYLEYTGNPVKASRLFAGYWHEQKVKSLATHFQVAADYFKTVSYNPAIIHTINPSIAHMPIEDMLQESLAGYESYEVAYHHFIFYLVQQQIKATNLALGNTPINQIFVDGGFSKNSIYMHLLANAFPTQKVYAASVAQATAVGAALAIHQTWNTKPLPEALIQLKPFLPSS